MNRCRELAIRISFLSILKGKRAIFKGILIKKKQIYGLGLIAADFSFKTCVRLFSPEKTLDLILKASFLLKIEKLYRTIFYQKLYEHFEILVFLFHTCSCKYHSGAKDRANSKISQSLLHCPIEN